MNICGKCLTVFPWLRVLIRKAYKAKTKAAYLPVYSRIESNFYGSLLSRSSLLHLLDPGIVFKVFCVYIK